MPPRARTCCKGRRKRRCVNRAAGQSRSPCATSGAKPRLVKSTTAIPHSARSRPGRGRSAIAETMAGRKNIACGRIVSAAASSRRRDPERRPPRPDLQCHQCKGRAKGCVPVALGDLMVFLAEIEPQEGDVPNQSRQQSTKPPPAPNRQSRSQREYRRHVEGVKGHGPPPAESPSDQPVQINMAREIIRPDIAIRSDAGIPGLGERREGVLVATPGPGQIMGGPARQHEPSRQSASARARPPSRARRDPASRRSRNRRVREAARSSAVRVATKAWAPLKATTSATADHSRG